MKTSDPDSMPNNFPASQCKKISKGFRTIAGREIQRICSCMFYPVFSLVLPLILFIFFSVLFRQGIVSNLPVAVLDLDRSVLSRTIIRMADATQGIQISQRMDNLAQGKTYITSGKGYGLLVLPRDMEKDIYSGRAANPAFYYNNQLLLAGGILKRAMGGTIATVSAGIDLKRRMKTGGSKTGARVHIEPVVLDNHVLFNPGLNYNHYLYAAILPSMLMILTICVTVHAVGMEIKENTCGNWLASAGGSHLAALAGKILPHTAILFISGLVMHILIFEFMNKPLSGSGGFILVATLLFILACQAAGLFCITLFKDVERTMGIMAIYAGSAFAFAGVTYPAMAMPALAKLWSEFLPLTHYLNIVTDQSLKGIDIRYSMPGFNFLLIFTFCFLFLSLLLTLTPRGIFKECHDPAF